MENKYKIHGTTFEIQGEQIKIQQMFLSEVFQRKDIIDIQNHHHQLLIQTKKNKFKVKYKEELEVKEIYEYLTQGTSNSETIDKFVLDYKGGHPNLNEDGRADVEIKSDRMIIETLHKTDQIEFKNIQNIRYENEVQIVHRLPSQKVILLNTMTVHIRSHPKANKYYLTIDFVNKMNQDYVAVFGGKQAKEAYETIKKVGHFHQEKVSGKINIKDFTYENPVRIRFGKESFSYLSELKESGQKVLWMYEPRDIQRNDLLNQIKEILGNEGLEVFELEGEVIKNQVDMILAIGSSINDAKILADSIDRPLYVIPTMASTGNETNDIVIVDGELKHSIFPKVAFLNPEYMFSVSKKETSYGLVYMVTKNIVNYLNDQNDLFKIVYEHNIKEIMKFTPIVFKDPTNYEARAKLLWISNQFVEIHDHLIFSLSRKLSMFYDVNEYECLAILLPIWLEENYNGEKNQFIRKIHGYLPTLDLPSHLKEIGIIDDCHFIEIAEGENEVINLLRKAL